MIFKFKGGTTKIAEHQLEKFYMFFILNNGKELSLYCALSLNLTHQEEIENNYSTNISTIKIIVVRKGFGCQHLRKTFVFKFNSTSPLTTITSFSGPTTGLFTANGRLLSKTEAYQTLGDEISKHYLLNEPKIPDNILESMIQIENNEEALRCIRIKKL